MNLWISSYAKPSCAANARCAISGFDRTAVSSGIGNTDDLLELSESLSPSWAWAGTKGFALGDGRCYIMRVTCLGIYFISFILTATIYHVHLPTIGFPAIKST